MIVFIFKLKYANFSLLIGDELPYSLHWTRPTFIEDCFHVCWFSHLSTFIDPQNFTIIKYQIPAKSHGRYLFYLMSVTTSKEVMEVCLRILKDNIFWFNIKKTKRIFIEYFYCDDAFIWIGGRRISISCFAKSAQLKNITGRCSA